MAKARLYNKIAEMQAGRCWACSHCVIFVATWRTMHTMSTREMQNTVQLSCSSFAEVGGADRGVRRPEAGMQAEGRVSGNRLHRAGLCQGSECVTAGDRCRGPLSP
jgi:hypothetical protein